jgi:glutamine amidotransferase-like uncharacterized protein
VLLAWPALAAASVALLACGSPEARGKPTRPPVLLFTGNGTSPSDVAAFERILRAGQHGYATVDSRQLDQMGEPQLKSHRLLIVPGGNFEVIGKGVAPNTSASVRRAVHGGLNYLGVCAGAFFAGDSPYNGLNLTSGVRFGFYALESQGVRKAAVPIAAPGSQPLDHYWEDGPQLTGWGEVVARYPDGTPAVAQGLVGTGWVILSGIHPEAPASWRRGMTFTTPAEVTNAYAATLIGAALNGTRLPHY